MKITAQELKTQLESGRRFQMLDVRSAQEFAEGHVPCAVNLPMEEAETRLDDLSSHDPLVLICQSGRRAQMTCELLQAHRSEILLLEGGTTAWSSAGLPLVRTVRARLPLMRQVQIVVGPLVLGGALLAILVDPLFALVCAFFGAGLTVAGATGFCGLAALLGKLPWNRPVSRQAQGGADVSEAIL